MNQLKILIWVEWVMVSKEIPSFGGISATQNLPNDR